MWCGSGYSGCDQVTCGVVLALIQVRCSVVVDTIRLHVVVVTVVVIKLHVVWCWLSCRWDALW